MWSTLLSATDTEEHRRLLEIRKSVVAEERLVYEAAKEAAYQIYRASLKKALREFEAKTQASSIALSEEGKKRVLVFQHGPED